MTTDGNTDSLLSLVISLHVCLGDLKNTIGLSFNKFEKCKSISSREKINISFDEGL